MTNILGALQRLNDLLMLGGIDLKGLARFVRGLPWYVRDRRQWIRKCGDGAQRSRFPLGRAIPCVSDRGAESGSANGHYFHQDLLVARRIFESNPRLHVDIGSRLDGFVAHVASFRKIDVFDIRTMRTAVPNVRFVQADLMHELPDRLRDYYDSVSSLHAIEHFGLGRYGDAICPDGHLIGLANIYKLLQTGGKFYFSVPIGSQRTEFNAHRVFSLSYLLEILTPWYSVDRFSLVDDRGDLHEDVALDDLTQDNGGCNFGCAIFELTKS